MALDVKGAGADWTLELDVYTYSFVFNDVVLIRGGKIDTCGQIVYIGHLKTFKCAPIRK